MALTAPSALNNAGYGAKYGQQPKPVIMGGEAPDGNIYPLQISQAGILPVATSQSLATTSAARRATPNGTAVELVPANALSCGKTCTNASVAGGATGVDAWIGKDNTVTAGNGHYFGPGYTQSFSGKEAVWVFAATSCLCTAIEELSA